MAQGWHRRGQQHQQQQKGIPPARHSTRWRRRRRGRRRGRRKRRDISWQVTILVPSSSLRRTTAGIFLHGNIKRRSNGNPSDSIPFDPVRSRSIPFDPVRSCSIPWIMTDDSNDWLLSLSRFECSFSSLVFGLALDSGWIPVGFRLGFGSSFAVRFGRGLRFTPWRMIGLETWF